MAIAFQVSLLIIIFFSAVMVTGEEEYPGVREVVLTVFIASLAAFIVSVMWL